MPLSASCSECGKTFKVGDDKAGKRLKCKCGGVIAVPADDEAEALEDDWGEPVPMPVRPAPRPASSRPSKPAGRPGSKSGSGLNPVLIIVGLLGILLVGGGVLAFVFLRGGGLSGGADPLAYLPQDANWFILVRPQRVMQSPLMKGLPAEMIDERMGQVTPQNPLGLDPRKLEFVAAYVLGPSANPPAAAAPGGMPGRPAGLDRQGAFLARYSEPLDVAAMVEKNKKPQDQVSEQTHAGKKYWRIVSMRPDFSALTRPPAAPGATPTPAAPRTVEGPKVAVVPIDDRTVLGGNEEVVLKILDGVSRGALAARLRGVSLDQDLVVAGLPSGDSGLASMAGMLGGGMMPGGPGPQIQQGVSETKAFVVTADLSGSTLLSVIVETTTSDAATKMETNLRDGHAKLKTQYQEMTKLFRDGPAPATPPATATPGAPASQPSPKDLIPFGDKLMDGIAISRSGSDVSVTLKNPGGWDVVVAALLPAIEQSRNAARQAQQRNNLRQIGLAFHNYHDMHQSFPPARGSEGSGLSWRVHLLPMLGEAALYEQFHKNEPWDSPHNKSLIEAMPAVYASTEVKEKGKTRVMGFSGEGAPFGRTVGLKLSEVSDGTSRTILAVEAGPEKAVVWTKPEDLPFHAADPKPALGTAPGGKFGMLLMDGSVRSASLTMESSVLKAFITFAGGEKVDALSLGF